MTNEERAREIAEQLFTNEYPRNALARLIAAALDAAEQRGMARAIKIAEDWGADNIGGIPAAEFERVYGYHTSLVAALRAARPEGETR